MDTEASTKMETLNRAIRRLLVCFGVSQRAASVDSVVLISFNGETLSWAEGPIRSSTPESESVPVSVSERAAPPGPGPAVVRRADTVPEPVPDAWAAGDWGGWAGIMAAVSGVNVTTSSADDADDASHLAVLGSHDVTVTDSGLDLDPDTCVDVELVVTGERVDVTDPGEGDGASEWRFGCALDLEPQFLLMDIFPDQEESDVDGEAGDEDDEEAV